MHAKGEEVRLVLLLAALDPSGGAGIAADVKTAHSLGYFPLSVVTAVTYQNTCEVRGVSLLESDIVIKQIEAVLDDVNVSWMKAGACVKAEYLDFGLKVVYDPVLRATVGHELTDVEESIKAAEKSYVITPNREEAKAMCSYLGQKFSGIEEVCEILHEELGCAVVVTGVEDLVYDGKRIERIKAEHSGLDVHGTGCVYSTALACFLQENDLFTAARMARTFVRKAAENPVYVGKCRPVVNV